MLLADFIHLRVHTAYSLSAGAIKIKELVALCKTNKMPAVAITDTGNLFGALQFSMACAEAGVQPIIGCDLAIRRGEGGARQVKDCKLAIAHGTGGALGTRHAGATLILGNQ